MCGALFDKCEGIFGPLILTNSSKDANNAGAIFLRDNICDRREGGGDIADWFRWLVV